MISLGNIFRGIQDFFIPSSIKIVQESKYQNEDLKKVRLYKIGNTWGFDDPYLNLIFEPFVFGSSELIQYLLDNKAKIKNKTTPTMIGSTKPLEGAIGLLRLKKEEDGGVWYTYYDTEQDVLMENWFCPWFHAFFKPVPEKIYIKFED